MDTTKSGEDTYDEIKKCIIQLEKEHLSGNQINYLKSQGIQDANTAKLNLERENFFLKRHVEDVLASAIVDPSPPSGPTRPRLNRSRKGQYRRYFEEREELERIEIVKGICTSKKIDDDIFNTTAMMEKLNKVSGVLHGYL